MILVHVNAMYANEQEIMEGAVYWLNIVWPWFCEYSSHFGASTIRHRIYQCKSRTQEKTLPSFLF